MNHDIDPETIERLRAEIERTHIELESEPAGLGLIPLRIQCVMASCTHGRHCFDHLRRARPEDGPTPAGSCRDCGKHVVDLPDQGGRNYGDPETLAGIVADQQHELIRAHYWTVPIDRWATNQAMRLGMRELQKRAGVRIRDALTVPSEFQGARVPYTRDILAYAQHATATCCRRCAAYWHGFPSDPSVEASPAQINHAVTLVKAYLKLRLPDMGNQPTVHVPPIRSDALPSHREIQELDDRVMLLLRSEVDPTGLLTPDRTELVIGDTRSHVVVSRARPVHAAGA
ncbi:MAG: DUF4186 family protein [Actinomycetales bacterium]